MLFALCHLAIVLIEILTSGCYDLLHFYSLPREKTPFQLNGVLKMKELTAYCISFMLELTICLISNDVGM